MAKKAKKQHGGKREGAGRPPTNPEGKTTVIAASVPAELVEQLDAFRAKHDWNRSQAVTEAIRGLVSAKH